MYKACWVEGCALSDITAAMEKAIEDGVDILSLSLGSLNIYTPYYSDPIAIGAFAVADRGIFVACFAGNDGPSPSLIVNTEPWITTVGAGSLDRTFPVQLGLGNGKVYSGDSLYNEEIVVCKGAEVDDGFLVQQAGGVGLAGLNWKEIGEGTTAKAFRPIALAQRRLQRRLGNILLHQHNQQPHCKHHVPSSNSFGESSCANGRGLLFSRPQPHCAGDSQAGLCCSRSQHPSCMAV
ncbi:hypothetical protein AAC387_Pa01g3877 [Persea americana]